MDLLLHPNEPGILKYASNENDVLMLALRPLGGLEIVKDNLELDDNGHFLEVFRDFISSRAHMHDRCVFVTYSSIDRTVLIRVTEGGYLGSSINSMRAIKKEQYNSKYCMFRSPLFRYNEEGKLVTQVIDTEIDKNTIMSNFTNNCSSFETGFKFFKLEEALKDLKSLHPDDKEVHEALEVRLKPKGYFDPSSMISYAKHDDKTVVVLVFTINHEEVRQYGKVTSHPQYDYRIRSFNKVDQFYIHL